MESVILFVTGGMFGGVVGLLVIALCVASSKQNIQDENARLRKVIYKTYDNLKKLQDEDITRNQLREKMRKITEEFKKAVEEG